jgi:hypothetical protein
LLRRLDPEAFACFERDPAGGHRLLLTSEAAVALASARKAQA